MKRSPIYGLSRLAHIPMKARHSSEIYSAFYSLSEAMGLQALQITHEILMPGHRASKAHYHSLIEEAVLIMTGEARLWFDGDWYPMKSQELAVFHPGPDQAHMLVNIAQEPVCYLALASQHAADQVIYIPEVSLESAYGGQET